MSDGEVIAFSVGVVLMGYFCVGCLFSWFYDCYVNEEEKSVSRTIKMVLVGVFFPLWLVWLCVWLCIVDTVIEKAKTEDLKSELKRRGLTLD